MKIYHNPRCSKSRNSHKLLQDKNIEFETIEYLKKPITKEELTDLLIKLGIPAIELVRKGESLYKDNYKGQNLTEEQLVDAMIKFPKLMERPIVVKGDKAVIGRPIENVLQLLNNN